MLNLLGNKKLLPIFYGNGPASKRARRDDGAMSEQSQIVPEGFVIYKGSIKFLNNL